GASRQSLRKAKDGAMVIQARPGRQERLGGQERLGMSLPEPARPAPLYQQVKQHIVARVLSGEWANGARLPSEQELVAALGVWRMTVHRAVRELSAEGLVARVQGVGTFVASCRPRSALIEIRDIAEEIVARGHRHRARVAGLAALRAGIELAAG